MKINTIDLAHFWLKQFIKEGDLCIDATAGRGNDTLFLCQCVKAQGHVLAFDIQEEALLSTKTLLEAHHQKAELIQKSHVHLDEYVAPLTVDGIIFNFGYLPGGDHQIATQKESSIMAIEKGLKALKVEGVMALCIYHGKDTGFEERDGILDYLKTLDYKKYTVIKSDFYNRPNCPPIFVGIRKDK